MVASCDGTRWARHLALAARARVGVPECEGSTVVRVPETVFDAILQDVMASLPEPFAGLLEQIPVVVDPWPSAEVMAREPDVEHLCGLYVGPSLAEWNATDALPETTVIYLFQRPLEDSCDSRAELAAQIRITLLHELGHALGFDEEGLERIGLE
jgi:predicted Zn-dependent protease with MMP-like domain